MKKAEFIYKEYFQTVYKYLLCLTRNADISEDLTQETFYKAILHINTFKGTSKMSTWLCSIAKNLWYNELKKQKKITDENIEFLHFYDYVDEKLIQDEEKEKLNNLIKKLDPQTAEVILLRIEGNLSFKEIGEILNQSESWARVVFYRGKNKLKEGVQNDE